MSKSLTISYEDIIRHLKLSCQIPHVMEAIATQKIITKAAQEAGIIVSEAERQHEGDRLRFAKKLVKAQDTWDWLKRNNLSLNEFEELVHHSIVSKKLADHLFANQVEPFFYKHQLDYTAAITYEVIFDERDLALELFYALKEGEISFQSIAREYIQELELRRAGGYQGIRRRRDFRPEIASAVFAANPPDILKPITTSKGVHLIWVEEIIHPNLDENLQREIITNLFSHWLKQQIEQIDFVMTTDSNEFSESIFLGEVMT